MKRKLSDKSDAAFEVWGDDFHKAIGGEELAIRRKLESLESLFAECQECPERFHERYVLLLVEEGLNLEVAFDLVVSSAVRTN